MKTEHIENYNDLYDQFGVESVPPDADLEYWVTNKRAKELCRVLVGCEGCAEYPPVVEQKSDTGVTSQKG